MWRLFIKYYFDVTKFNILFCVVFFITKPNLIDCIIVFGSVGSIISFFVFKYFYEIQYFFYANCGLSKRVIQIRTLFINLLIAISTIIILWSIHY